MQPFGFLTLALLAAALAGGGWAAAPRPDGQVAWRAAIGRDSAQVLGRAAAAEIAAAGTVVLVRRPVQFPSLPAPPAVAAAVRKPGGWVRIGANGVRRPLDPAAARELDRLLSSRDFWTEPPAEGRCTDPSGILVLARSRGRERLSAFPCGWQGLTADAARIVLAGRITDWSRVPASHRPAGLPLARFDESIQDRFRFTSGLYEGRLLAIRSRPEWEGQWRRITARQGEAPPPPVDFGREMLLMAAMGPQPSGGHVVIDKVVQQEGELLAFVRFVSPRRRCGAIAAVTSPVDLVRLPASGRNVRWAVERQSADCP